MLNQIIQFRNWAFFAGFVTIFVGAIVCSFLYAISYPPSLSGGQIVERDDRSATTPQQSIAGAEHSSDQVPLAVTIVPPSKSEAETKEDQQDRLEKASNERGLTVATWILAFATAFLFAAAVGQVFLFFWQSRLIGESLRDAKIAAEAAKESADATKIQAMVARDTLTKVQRPYVFVFGVNKIAMNNLPRPLFRRP